MREVREIVQQAFDLQKAGRIGDAQEIYEKLLGHLEPPDPNVLMGYGVALANAQLHGLASYLFRGALETGFGEFAGAWSNLGLSYLRLDRREAAKACYEKALECDPRCSDALANLSGWYINNDTAKEAEHWARRALEVDAEMAPGHAHLALALMEQGRFDEAWEHYGWRWKLPEQASFARPYKCAHWDGDFEGRLAIHGEQGVGDEILFASRLQEASKRAEWIAVECMERLIPIFERSFPDIEFYPNHEALIEGFGEPDAHCAFGDLFELCGMPDGKPYLLKPPRGDNFAHRDIRRVGLAWRGGTYRTNKKERSLSLRDWAPILAVPGVEFVSVQYERDHVLSEARDLRLPIEVDSRSVEQAANAIAGCDLVISVCQTAVHLAGAMGVPCWVLTPKRCAWRYTGADCKSRFYDSVKLYRQDDTESWQPVIQRIANDLRLL